MALTGPQNSADVSEPQGMRLAQEVQRCCFEALAFRSRLNRVVGPICVDSERAEATATTRLSLEGNSAWVHAHQLFPTAVKMCGSLQVEGEHIAQVESAQFREVVATNLSLCARDITKDRSEAPRSPFSATFLTDRERRIEVTSQVHGGRLPKTKTPRSLFEAWIRGQPRSIWDTDQRAFPPKLAGILNRDLELVMLSFWFEWLSFAAFTSILEERTFDSGCGLIRSMTGFEVPSFEDVSQGSWESFAQPIGVESISKKGFMLLQAQTELSLGDQAIGGGTMTFAIPGSEQRQELEATAHQIRNEGTPGNRSFAQWLVYQLRTLKGI